MMGDRNEVKGVKEIKGKDLSNRVSYELFSISTWAHSEEEEEGEEEPGEEEAGPGARQPIERRRMWANEKIICSMSPQSAWRVSSLSGK